MSDIYNTMGDFHKAERRLIKMKVVIVDDDAIVAMSLQTILSVAEDVEVVGLGNDGSEAIALYEQHRPDILLTDIQMKNVSGLEAAAKIIEKYPQAKIVLLTTFMDDEYVRDALKVGAKGYILKQDFESVLPAIRAVYSGQSVFGSEIVSSIPRLLSAQDEQKYKDTDLNEKEKEIIEAIAEGLSNKEIAAKLFLSEGTVRNYISSILEKLELRDRTQIAIFYYKH